MTIRTIEAGVPTSLPPARMFLDDIEEIVSLLVEATENHHRERKYASAETKVTLRIGDQVCDELEELPKIAAKTAQLDIKVDKGWADCSLSIERDATYLFFVSFANNDKLSLFNKLAPIFKRRNRRLATLARSLPGLHFALAMIWASIILMLMSGKKITPIWGIVVGLPPLAVAVTLWVTGYLHGVVILRRSTEPSPFRQGLAQKILLIVVTSILTFSLTVLGMYLKHKFWP